MQTLLPVITLVLGIALNEILSNLRSRRDRTTARINRYEKFRGDTLASVLPALNEAYEAAAVIGLNSDKHGIRGGAEAITTDEHWSYREPFVNACGSAAFRLRAIAVLLPTGESPRIEVDAFAQAATDMVGQGTAKEISQRFVLVEAAMLPAREAVANRIHALYAPPTPKSRQLGGGTR